MQVGTKTFRMCRGMLDGVILVDDSAISAAIKDVFNETRSTQTVQYTADKALIPPCRWAWRHSGCAGGCWMG